MAKTHIAAALKILRSFTTTILKKYTQPFFGFKINTLWIIIKKKKYCFFKENLTLFALVPTALGGIWQICKLGFISINMIRFFSVSQLISDGIIILLIIFFPMFIYALPFVRSAVNQKKKGTNLFNKDQFLAHFIFILLELILVLGVIFYFEVYTYINIDNLSILLQRIHILYVVLIIVYFLISKFL